MKGVNVQRYWIEFDEWLEVSYGIPRPNPPFGRGIGVTAWSLDHALRMIAWAYDAQPPAPHQVIEGVDVSLLVISDWEVGVPVWPGIWLPAMNLWLAEKDWPD